MNQQAERRVGTIIGGKWRVDALLGSGSMAAVYAVTHRNGARAALKILHPTLCTDPSVCERFLGEGYLANSVKHTGIVRVLDDGVTDDGCVFLVMDLLEGRTLETLRQDRGNKIPLQESLDIADKLMDVLSAVHAAGIIHRDLKPQNVFICDDGTVKLLDFGVARVFDRTAQSKLSMFGLVLGTPSFMSPEQALGSREKVDHRSDIWSLGATLFTSLTGETVHLGANVQAKLLAAATVKARSIAMVMPSLPAPIANAIDMALRFKKEERWQTVDAMRRTLREARQTLGLGKPASIAPPPMEDSLAMEPGFEDTVISDNKKAKVQTLALIKSAPPKPESSLPPAPAHGPDGTFIGMGGSDGKIQAVVGNDGSMPPAVTASAPPGVPRPGTSNPAGVRPPMKSQPPPDRLAPSIPPNPKLPQLSRAPAAPETKPLPQETPGGSFVPPSAPPKPLAAAAVVRHLPTPTPAEPLVVRDKSAGEAPPSVPPAVRGSRPDGQEGSLPAYGGTVKVASAVLPDESSQIDLADVGVRRKGSVAVWLVAVVLAAAALGGITFFAVKREQVQPAGSDPTPSATAVTPPPSATVVPTTPTAPPATATPSASIRVETSATPSASASAPPAAPVVVRPVAPVTPRGGGGGHGSRTNPARTTPTTDPTPTPTPTPTPPATDTAPKATPPGLAPDPFATPE